MIKRTLYFIIILTLLLYSLTGCYDSNGIENFYYIVALGIDKSQTSKISLSIQIAKTSNSSENASSQSSESKIYTVDCASIDSGISILNNYLNKKINLSHCSVFIFSEEIAKSGLLEYINSLSNNPEIKSNSNIIISSTTAIDVLNNVSNTGESFSSRLYEYIITSSNYTGYTRSCEFSEFLSKINTPNTPALAIYAKVNNDTIQNDGLAVFKYGKMLGTLSPLDTISHLIIDGKLDTCIISIVENNNENSLIDLEISQNIEPTIDINLTNNIPYISINIELNANISSSGKTFDYTTEKNIQNVENTTNKYITNLLTSYLYKSSKEYNADLIGFGNKLSTKYLTLDDFQNIHWNNIFKNSIYNVNVKTKINSSYMFNKE